MPHGEAPRNAEEKHKGHVPDDLAIFAIIRSTSEKPDQFYRSFSNFSLCSQVDLLLSRDLDSLISDRERSAVEEWISSGETTHVMRDNVHHWTPMLGGMWGMSLKSADVRKSWRKAWYVVRVWVAEKETLSPQIGIKLWMRKLPMYPHREISHTN